MKYTHLFWIFILILTGCLPQVKEANCPTGQAFNTASRSCSAVTGGATAAVFITGKIPSSSYAVQFNSAVPTDHSIIVSNPNNVVYSIQWKLYSPPPVTVTTLTPNVTTVTITPSVHFTTSGSYVLQASLVDGSNNTLASTDWTITATTSAPPSLSINTSNPNLASTTTSRTTTDTTPQQFGVTITNPSSLACSVRWYYDGQLKTTDACASTQSEVFFVTGDGFIADDPPLTATVHTVKAELVNGATIYDSLEYTIYTTSPNLTSISTAAPPIPAQGTTVTVIDGLALNANGWLVGATAMTGVNDDFCVAVTDFDGTDNSSGVYIQYMVNSVAYGSPVFFTANNDYKCLSDVNAAATLTLANASVGEFKTMTANIVDAATGSQAFSVSWGLSIRAKNTVPTVASDTANGSPAVGAVTCAQDSATGCTFVVESTDADETVNSTDFEIRYTLDGVLMDGSVNNYLNTTVLSPDCFYPSGVGINDARRTCAIAIPSYDVNGRRDVGVYTLSATTKDNGANGGAALTSNPISWTITTTLAQTAPVVLSQVTSGSTTNNSFISISSSPTTATGSAIERQDILFNIKVQDAERDDFRVTINSCQDAACTILNSPALVNNALVTKTNSTLTTSVSYSQYLSEATVTSAASGLVYYRVLVQDDAPNPAVDLSDTEIFSLTVTNLNPFPIAGGTPTPAVGTALIVMTGFPLTIDGGTFTDASTADGQIIQYQWQISKNNGTWTDVEGATSKTLSWTPIQADAALTSIRFRLCLGDDGFGNSVSTLCSQVASPSAPDLPAITRVVGPWTAVVAKSNEVAVVDTSADIANAAQGLSNTSAVWKDPTNGDVYTAHIENAAPSSKIYVNKISYASNGTITQTASLSFNTEYTGSSYDAKDLSMDGSVIKMTGQNREFKNLYISYVTSSTNPPVTPQLKIRHIDLTGGRFQFDYSGVIVNDTGTNNFSVAQGASPYQLTVTVNSNSFTAGDYIQFHGIRINYHATTQDVDCSDGEIAFVPSPISINLTIANIINTYNSCVYTTDPRRGLISFSQSGNTFSTSNFPVDWIDLNYLITKAGRIKMTGCNYNSTATTCVESENDSRYITIPFIDGLNSNKISFVTFGPHASTTDYESGSLGSINGPSYKKIGSYFQLNTIASYELDNDVVTAVSGTTSFQLDFAVQSIAQKVAAYRYNFTPPATLTAVASNSDVFTTYGSYNLERIRIASGYSTTDDIYVMAQDAISTDNELLLGRLDDATLASQAVASTPLSTSHYQTMNLYDYQIEVLPNEAGSLFIAALTSVSLTDFLDSNTVDGSNMALTNVDGYAVLTSKIKPITPGSSSYVVYPPYASPADDNLIIPLEINSQVIEVPLALSQVYEDFAVGTAGYTALENTKDTIWVMYPDDATQRKLGAVNTVSEDIDGEQKAYISE